MEVKKTALRTAFLIYMVCYCAAQKYKCNKCDLTLSQQNQNGVQRLHLTADSIEYFATFLHSSATINDRVIQFGPGTSNELLLEVPLGPIDPHATIIITLGLDNSYPNSFDADPQIGISDGTNKNVIVLFDVTNTDKPPCAPVMGVHDNVLISSRTVPATFKLTFTPFYKYGSCETAQEGGYINTGRFNAQLDVIQPLKLILERHHESEQYFFYYFLVEIYSSN